MAYRKSEMNLLFKFTFLVAVVAFGTSIAIPVPVQQPMPVKASIFKRALLYFKENPTKTVTGAAAVVFAAFGIGRWIIRARRENRSASPTSVGVRKNGVVSSGNLHPDPFQSGLEFELGFLEQRVANLPIDTPCKRASEGIFELLRAVPNSRVVTREFSNRFYDFVKQIYDKGILSSLERLVKYFGNRAFQQEAWGVIYDQDKRVLVHECVNLPNEDARVEGLVKIFHQERYHFLIPEVNDLTLLQRVYEYFDGIKGSDQGRDGIDSFQASGIASCVLGHIEFLRSHGHGK